MSPPKHPSYLSASERILQFALMRLRPAFIASRLKRLLQIERREVETPIGRLYVDPVSQFGAEILGRGEYEPEMLRTLRRFLKPAGIFVDVGANEGYFSIVASALVGPSGKVIAVEPQTRLNGILERNFKLNDIRNVCVHHCAISDRTSMADLYLSPDTNTGSSALHQSTQYRLPVEQVATITLAELFARAAISRADLMKMDIEGYEFEAVLGSKALFEERRIATIALELHPGPLSKRGRDVAEITGFLERCGYRLCAGFSNTVWSLPDNTS